MKIIRLLMIFIFILSIPCNLLAFDASGWYVATNNNPHFPEYIKITNTHFLGIPYKVIEEENDFMKISLANSKENTNIAKKDDGILITTVRGENIFYRFLTNDISLSKQEIAKMGQSEK